MRISAQYNGNIEKDARKYLLATSNDSLSDVKRRNTEIEHKSSGTQRSVVGLVKIIQGVTGGTDQTSGGCSLC